MVSSSSLYPSLPIVFPSLQSSDSPSPQGTGHVADPKGPGGKIQDGSGHMALIPSSHNPLFPLVPALNPFLPLATLPPPCNSVPMCNPGSHGYSFLAQVTHACPPSYQGSGVEGGAPAELSAGGEGHGQGPAHSSCATDRVPAVRE